MVPLTPAASRTSTRFSHGARSTTPSPRSRAHDVPNAKSDVGGAARNGSPRGASNASQFSVAARRPASQRSRPGRDASRRVGGGPAVSLAELRESTHDGEGLQSSADEQSPAAGLADHRVHGVRSDASQRRKDGITIGR